LILQPPLRSIPKHHRHTAIHFHRDTLHHTCPKLAVELRHRLSLRRKRPLEHRQPLGLGFEISPYKKYTMYLGTKDKNTGRQEISTEKMKSRMHEICMKYVDGYTVSVMDGYYRDEKGNPVHEVSLVYFFLDTPIDALEHIMEEAILEFNQSSILLEESEARSILYKGAHNAK